MAAGRPRGQNDPSLIASLESALREVPRPGPIGVLVNWRLEFAVLAGAAIFSFLIVGSLGLIGLAAVAGAGLAATGALLCWPPARKRVIAHLWCRITPHRVRVGCMNAWVQSRRGRLPFVISTSTAAYGERVRLWCPAGVTAADLLAASDVLASACWALQVRVVPGTRSAHLVTLEVVRRILPERTVPAAPGWPYSRHAEGDDQGEDRDRNPLVA